MYTYQNGTEDAVRIRMVNQKYATGDVLQDLIRLGWTITNCRSEVVGKARVYNMTFNREQEELNLSFLDNPIVRDKAKTLKV